MAPALLEPFEWSTIVAESLRSFQEEEERRTAMEAKFAAQLKTDLECATHQSKREDRRDQMERAAESSCNAVQLAVFRVRADRQKVNSDELAERREAAKKEEEKNEKQRQLVMAQRKASGCLRAEVMRLIEVQRTRAKKESRKGKGTKFRRWETDLSTQALALVTTEGLLDRARDAGVDQEELELALRTCENGIWQEYAHTSIANGEAHDC